MGGHWIKCDECEVVTRFSNHTMWLDDTGNIHTSEDLKCSECDKVLLKGEPG